MTSSSITVDVEIWEMQHLVCYIAFQTVMLSRNHEYAAVCPPKMFLSVNSEITMSYTRNWW